MHMTKMPAIHSYTLNNTRAPLLKSYDLRPTRTYTTNHLSSKPTCIPLQYCIRRVSTSFGMKKERPGPFSLSQTCLTDSDLSLTRTHRLRIDDRIQAITFSSTPLPGDYRHAAIHEKKQEPVMCET
jgi:hypothetical protein